MEDLSSLTRDQTCSLFTGRGRFNHWTAREFPKSIWYEDNSLIWGSSRGSSLWESDLWVLLVRNWGQNHLKNRQGWRKDRRWGVTVLTKAWGPLDTLSSPIQALQEKEREVVATIITVTKTITIQSNNNNTWLLIDISKSYGECELEHLFKPLHFFFFFLVQSPNRWKTVRRLFKSKITMWSSNFPSGCVSKGNEINVLKRYLHPLFTATLFTIVKTQRQRKHSKALTMTTAEPYIPYMWNLGRCDINELIYKTERDSQT